MTYAINLKGIDKSFGEVKANDHIDLDVEKGHIHALLGENGSGKTTLMRILCGELKPESGMIIINGQEAQIRKPSDSIAKGLGFIHQHFMLIDRYSIVENFTLGHEKRRWLFFVDNREARKKAGEIMKNLNLPLDIDKPVEKFSIEEQQIIEIGKVMFRGANILILDEPTSVLSPQKIDNLLKLLLQLKEQGKTIIFITHKLKECLAIADDITVLRSGKKISTKKRSELDEGSIVKMMIGEGKIEPLTNKVKTDGNPYLVVKNLKVSVLKQEKVRDVSFEIRQGEIFCITGVGGNGQKELLEAITGMIKQSSGDIYFGEHLVNKLSIYQRRKIGMSYIPENRMKTGAAVDLSISDNLKLGHHWHPTLRKGIHILTGKTKWFAQYLFNEYSIKGESINAEAGSLSGGNLQKVIIAREFSFDKSKLLIIAYPSQGIDIRLTQFVHQEIIKRRNAGCAILLLTGDLDEAFRLSDRIGVFFHGKLVTVKEADKTSRIEIGEYMIGSKSSD